MKPIKVWFIDYWNRQPTQIIFSPKKLELIYLKHNPPFFTELNNLVLEWKNSYSKTTSKDCAEQLDELIDKYLYSLHQNIIVNMEEGFQRV